MHLLQDTAPERDRPGTEQQTGYSLCGPLYVIFAVGVIVNKASAITPTLIDVLTLDHNEPADIRGATHGGLTGAVISWSPVPTTSKDVLLSYICLWTTPPSGCMVRAE